VQRLHAVLLTRCIYVSFQITVQCKPGCLSGYSNLLLACRTGMDISTVTFYWLVERGWILGREKTFFCSLPHVHLCWRPTNPPTQWV
jgi:hypothetical protein